MHQDTYPEISPPPYVEIVHATTRVARSWNPGAVASWIEDDKKIFDVTWFAGLCFTLGAITVIMVRGCM